MFIFVFALGMMFSMAIAIFLYIPFHDEIPWHLLWSLLIPVFIVVIARFY